MDSKQIARAREALDSMDDFARMSCGVDAIGPRKVLEDFISAVEGASQDVRAAFEAWNGPHYLSRNNTPGSDTEGYQSSFTNRAWEAWKASAAPKALTVDELDLIGCAATLMLTAAEYGMAPTLKGGADSQNRVQYREVGQGLLEIFDGMKGGA